RWVGRPAGRDEVVPAKEELSERGRRIDVRQALAFGRVPEVELDVVAGRHVGRSVVGHRESMELLAWEAYFRGAMIGVLSEMAPFPSPQALRSAVEDLERIVEPRFRERGAGRHHLGGVDLAFGRSPRTALLNREREQGDDTHEQ